jgi:hypothetical protein
MTDRQYDKVFINPTPAELAAALVEATDTANYRARERKVAHPNGMRVFDNEPEGIWWADGGGVPNSYGYSTGSSAVGYAWWTDEHGNRHVRVVARRVRIYGNHVTCVFGPYMAQKTPKDVVYPGGYEAKITVLDILSPSEN